MDDRLKQLEDCLKSHGPYSDTELLAVQAHVAFAQSGNKTRASKLTGINRRTLRVRLRWFRNLVGKD